MNCREVKPFCKMSNEINQPFLYFIHNFRHRKCSNKKDMATLGVAKSNAIFPVKLQERLEITIVHILFAPPP